MAMLEYFAHELHPLTWVGDYLKVLAKQHVDEAVQLTVWRDPETGAWFVRTTDGQNYGPVPTPYDGGPTIEY